MNKKSIICLFTLCLCVSACATDSKKDLAYVSSTHYADYNCKQISSEMRRVSTKLEQINQTKENETTEAVLTTALSAFAISRGGSYYVQENDNTEKRRLVNQYDVLEQTAIKKECN